MSNEEYELASSEEFGDEGDTLINPPDSPLLDNPILSHPNPWQGFLVRALALLCACSLSIGSHYASYILGPLKSRLARELGTSNAQFSLIISAYSLNSTWTPLVGGLLVTRLGTAWTSVLATSLILLGQAVLLLGHTMELIPLMVSGMFIFGLGISPLSVAQETIIVRFFKSHGLGVSLALGLVAGKGASFIAAETSFPLSERFGPRAPFILATSLAAFSFAVNLVYLFSSSWLARNSGVQLEPSEQPQRGARRLQFEQMSDAEAVAHVASRKVTRISDLTRLGDVFWIYIAINVLCGAIWSPFTHLAANIIEHRYSLTESQASQQASLLLAGSVVLYPLCGYITDRVKRGLVVYWLFALSSVLTLSCYVWLSAPPSFTRTALPAMISFGTGHGFSTLLLVLIVPQIVSLQYVPTALGTHKSIEQAGSTMSQTLAGLALDANSSETASSETVQQLLNTFLIINIIQFCGVLFLWRLDFTRRRAKEMSGEAEYQPLETSDCGAQIHLTDETVEEDDSLRDDGSPKEQPDISRSRGRRPSAVGLLVSSPLSRQGTSYTIAPSSPAQSQRSAPKVTMTEAEHRRGEVSACLCIAVVILTWGLFLTTAWLKLRRKDAQSEG